MTEAVLLDGSGEQDDGHEELPVGDNVKVMQIGADGAVIVADLRGEQQPPHAGAVTHVIKVRVADVDAQFERAGSHRARVVQEPIEHEC